MTNRFFYFKVTFLSLSAGIFVGMVFYGIFDINFSNSEELSKLLWKSFVTAIGTGLIMGILNMFFKIGNFPKKENSWNRITFLNNVHSCVCKILAFPCGWCPHHTGSHHYLKYFNIITAVRYVLKGMSNYTWDGFVTRWFFPLVGVITIPVALLLELSQYQPNNVRVKIPFPHSFHLLLNLKSNPSNGSII